MKKKSRKFVKKSLDLAFTPYTIGESPMEKTTVLSTRMSGKALHFFQGLVTATRREKSEVLRLIVEYVADHPSYLPPLLKSSLRDLRQ